MGMQDMTMTFFTSQTTPLYSSAWVPTTYGQYAGTQIFLIVLAVIFRGLIALRWNFSRLVRKNQQDQRGVVDSEQGEKDAHPRGRRWRRLGDGGFGGRWIGGDRCGVGVG